jgi:membrane associated rhomboid family serine protease
LSLPGCASILKTQMSTPGMYEVFRAPQRRPCEERALVLMAVGISPLTRLEAGWFVLTVEEPDLEAARRQLALYESENRPLPLPPPLRLHRRAWLGSVAYGVYLVAVAQVLARGLVRLDAFDTGDLDGAQVQAGQWWRAWTALTLHLDPPHLVANLGAGMWFGYLAGRYIGPGTAWMLTVSGAAAANLIEGLLGPAAHRSVGASTAVFTALGIMSAYAWRERLALRQRWPTRVAPLMAGLALLGWLGSSGEGTDLIAHVLGFGVGIVLGALAATPVIRQALARVPEWLAGLLALAQLTAAWALALRS